MKSIEKFTTHKLLTIIGLALYSLSSIIVFVWGMYLNMSYANLFLLVCAGAGIFGIITVSKRNYTKYLETTITFYENTKKDYEKEVEKSNNGIINCEKNILKYKEQLKKHEEYVKK